MEKSHMIKRKALSVSDKMDILRKFDSEGHGNKTVFAKSVNISESTLRTLLKNRDTIEKSALAGGSKRMKVKAGKYEEMEKILFDWYAQARASNIPVNGPIMKEKALQIAKTLNMNFEPSSGWLDRFKNRYGIVYKQVSGEAASVNTNDVECWKTSVLPQIMKRYASRDIFNVDEFGLFFKLMPNKTFAVKGEKCTGGKLSKDRVTVLIGGNADGTEKIKPLVIGKSRNPRSFSNMQSLPCEYRNQDRAWMTGDLFISWVRSFDKQMQKNSRMVVLFVDNCPAHPKNIPGLQNVRVEFLPPNSTSVLQPMDQGVIKVLKQHYRKRLVQRFLIDMEQKRNVKPASVNLLDAMYYLSAAWDSIKPETILNCFRKAGFTKIEDDEGLILEESEELDDPLLSQDWVALTEHIETNQITLQEYIHIDEGICTSEVRSLDDIIKDAKATSSCADDSERDADEDMDDDEQEPSPIPSLTEVENAFNVLRRYVIKISFFS